MSRQAILKSVSFTTCQSGRQSLCLLNPTLSTFKEFTVQYTGQMLLSKVKTTKRLN